MRRALRPHQKKYGYNYCLENCACALFWEMRLGKSLVPIRIEKIRKTKSVLIVAPYSALLSWEKEIILENETFVCLDMQVNDIKLKTKYKPGRLTILKQTFHKVKYVMISKECHRFVPEIKEFSWDTIILDEAHFIRNLNDTSEYYLKNFKNIGYKYVLTGTPAPERELDY